MEITRRGWLGLASAAALGAAAAQAAPPPSIQLLTRGKRDASAMLATLAAYAEQERQACGLPALTLGVSGPDGLHATISLGFADRDRGVALRPDHLFQIGSISKSIVALCLFHLADQGKLDLDVKANTILPEIPWPNGDITIAMLLNHSAGLADIAPAFPRSPDGRLWTNYTVGTRFSYSNTAFGLLGMIVEKVSGLPYHEAVRAFVFAPLGMSSAVPLIRAEDRPRYPIGYVPLGIGAYFPGDPLTPGPWVNNELAGGSVAATASDMVRYIAYLARVGRGEGAPIMSDALARRYARPTIAAPEMGPGGQYANGIATVDLDGRQCLQHTGGMVTFFSSITVDPIAGGGVFASTNAAAGNFRPRRITFYGCRLLRAFVEGRSLPEPPAIVPVPAIKDAAALAGRFLSMNGDMITLSAQGDTLMVEADGVHGRLQQQNGALVTNHPRLAEHPIDFVEDGPRQDSFWWGGTLYGRDRALPAPAPSAVAALAGRYVSEDPWWGRGFSIVARGQQLVLEGLGPLVRADDGSWRSQGDAMAAERFWFEAYWRGRPQRLVFSGNDLRRFPDG